MQGSCAIHPGTIAARTCRRCGNFMCDTCSEQRTADYCPPCRAVVGAGVVGFPLHRDTWTFDALLNYCWSVFQRDWLVLSLAVLVLYVISFGMNMVSTIVRLGIMASGSIVTSAVVGAGFLVVQILVQGVMQLGTYKLTLDSLQNKRLEFTDLFRQIARAPQYVGQLFLIGCAIGIPVGIVSGAAYLVAKFAVHASDETSIIASIGVFTVAFMALFPVILPLSFAALEIVHDQQVGVIQSLKNCFKIGSGQRLYIFLIILLVIPISVVGVLAFCIGILPATAFYQLLIAGLYLTLRNGAQLQQPQNPQFGY